MSDNYIELTIEEVYEVIRAGDHWPKEFTTDRKIKMLENIIGYYEAKDEFEKCAFLLYKINELKNPKQKIRSPRNN